MFLNLWGNNDSNHDATISFGSKDLSGRDWTLEFEFAGYSGCNNKVGHTYLKSGSTNLFDIEDASNWNTTFTIKYGSEQTATIAVAPCNKDTRQKAETGGDLNTTTYWHHFKIEGSDAGVKLTVTNSNSGIKILDAVELSATNLNPTSIVAKPSATGAIAFDQLRLYYTTTYGEMYSEAKAPYDTKVASLDAAGQSYWTAYVTSSASVTDEASYNTAVAALPTTYIAAVKAQTTGGSDMTDAMPTGNAGWTCSQGNGPASYLSTGATETYSDGGATYAKFSTGDIMSQTITGLQNGLYQVQFYGVVNAANDVSTVSGSDLVQAYANDVNLDIDVVKQNSCTPTNYLRTIQVEVTDGTLTYGLKVKDGVTDAGNWAVAKTYKLTFLGDTKYNYTINAVAGGTIKQLAAGSEYPTVEFGTYVPYVILYNSKYYVLDDNSTYYKTFTLGTADATKEVNYTLDESIVYFAEANSIYGGHSSYGTYSNNAKYSMGNGVGCYTDSYITTSSTFTPGVYNIMLGCVVRNGSKTQPYGISYSTDEETWTSTGVSISYSGTAGSVYTPSENVQLASTSYLRLTNNYGGNAQDYLDYILIRRHNVSKTITAAGWATYCSPYPLDFSGSIDNLTKAWLVTGATGNTLKLKEITGTVPANTGILLEGEGAVTIPVVASSSTDVSENKLVGVTANTEIAAEAGYVLMDETAGVGFYKNNKAFTVGANTAYLPSNFAGAPSARMAFFGFDDEATGVQNLTPALSEGEGVVYNLRGQRVAQPTKGLYIVNGKKVVIK